MPYALIAKAIAGSGDSNNVTTGSITTTGADLLIAVVADFGAGTTTTLTDSKSNTWNALTAHQSGTAARNRLYWSKPTSVGAGHTATLTSTGQFPAIDFRAYSGSAASPFDQQNGAAAAAATTLATGSITPTVAGCLIVAGVTGDAGTGFSIDSSFTNLDNVSASGNNEACAGADLIQTSASAVNPTWTNTGGADDLAASIASFKPAALGNMFEVF